MKNILIRRIGLCLIAILVTILITFTHAVAEEIPFYWDYINVNIDVQTNGDMLVTEEQKYVFKSDYSNQRYRYIRLDKVNEIKDMTVENKNQIIPSETGIENNQLWIRWQHQLKPPEAHTFVLKYRVVGGLYINGDNTQVYWKAIFADRKAPIKAAKVRVQLPEVLSGKVLDFKKFGTAATASQVNPKTFEFVATQTIQLQEKLEIQITFPSNILNITKPNWQQGNFWDNWGIILAGLLVLVFFSKIILAINNRQCPQCQKFTLNWTYKEFSVTTIKGQQRVIRFMQECKNCSVHNNYEKATPVVNESRSVSEDSDNISNQSGYIKAIGDYNQTLNLNLAASYYNQGNTCAQSGDMKGAMEYYNQALSINFNFAEAYLNRGNTRSELGDIQGAMEDYNQALIINPNLAEVYIGKGSIRSELGDVKGAMKDYNQALTINPNLAEAYSNRGFLYAQLKDIRGAMKDYNQALIINPNLAESYANRGLLYFQSGDINAAFEDYNQALIINPELAEAYANRGLIFAQLGDFKGAITDLQKAFKLFQQQGKISECQSTFNLIKKINLKPK